MKRAPNKLTPEVRARVLQAIRTGCYVETAAAYAGISKQTLFNWLREGARGDPRAVEFHREFTEALARAELKELAIISKAAEKSWPAAAWILERRFPKRWGQNRDTELVKRKKYRAETRLAEAKIHETEDGPKLNPSHVEIHGALQTRAEIVVLPELDAADPVDAQPRPADPLSGEHSE